VSEVLRALGVLCEPPRSEHARVAAALELPGAPDEGEHTDLFLFQLYPYASVYLGAEGMMGGEARDRVAGFWSALGLLPPAEPDHLAALLGLAAWLADRERDQPDPARARFLRHARRALLHEHLLPWLPPFLAKLDELGPPFYASWGRLLTAALADQIEELGEPESLPVHLRLAPSLEHPAEAGGDAFLNQLLAPVRTGLVLARDDLVRAAADLNLGRRLAERRFVLRALLAQDAPATLSWIGRLAGEAAATRRCTTVVERFWYQRVQAAAALLAEVGVAAARQEVGHAG